MAETIEGYVILGPSHPLELGMHTFGRTAADAWRRHIGPRVAPHPYDTIGEFETLVSRWSAKGWRPVAATLSLNDIDRSTPASEPKP